MPIPRSIQTKNAREKREQTERNTQAWKKHEKSSAWWLNQSWWQWKSTERWHSPLTVIVIAIVGGSDMPRFANAQILWGCSFDVQLNHRTIHKCSLNIKGRQAGIAPLSSYNYFFPSFLPPLAHSLSFPSSLPLSLPTIAIPSHSYSQRLKAIHRRCLSGWREGAFVSVRTRSMNNKHKTRKEGMYIKHTCCNKKNCNNKLGSN